ncbi:hypothetical protein BO70DRAFT_387133 [Aspergillus heteromorphus CBS 117.55]|uniref:Zn(2)-C6 fungal-type domain-containing protein n=1 Tax=Aspergillus heteromorphus CBS 117.55 TaxID=1448321 RepID=A0A317WCR1_9EURO|nr:uncharacterized protein BO70DRAFT_387133 [Aspergillus heteromorphus CBS 117.55]PWY82992.1 hypothetical protein BO70DRAFT_387133 [Aspergillus heteromorphus CBS 117.55]
MDCAGGSPIAVASAESSRLNRSGKVRKKQWAPKVKTGCVTCSCLKCSSTGRKCDGYDPVPREQTSSPDPVQMPPPWELVSGNPVELDSFRFFCDVTTPDLAAPFDTGFWSGRLLQVAHHYPALWHAMTALGSIHRDFITDPTPIMASRTEDSQKIGFALLQFNTSIQCLRDMLAGPALTSLDRLVVLSICILFTCSSSLQGRQWQAFMHINSGLKLLHHWNLGSGDRSPPEEDLDMTMLLVALTQLDTQARPYICGRLGNLQWTESPVVIPPVTPPFQSLLEAYIALEVHFNRMMQLVMSRTYDPTLESLSKKQKLVHDLHQWDDRLADYLSQMAPQPSDRQALRLINIRRAFTRIYLSLDPSKGELAHDDLIDDYADMLQLAGEILDDAMQSRIDSPAQPTFRLAATVIEPLFLIASRCREPTLRRQALQLLKRHPRREGICEGMSGAKVVQRVMDLEEQCLYSPEGCSGSGKWVCVDHRVTSMQQTDRKTDVVRK